MDWGQAGEEIAKSLSVQHVGVDVLYGEVLGRRDDGTVTVSVDGGTVAARAMASFDVGAAVGRQVMLVSKGGVLTIMGAMATSDNSHDFTDAVESIRTANANIAKIEGDVQQVAQDVQGVKADAEIARQAAQQASQSADAAAQSAKAAGDKADALQGQVSEVQTTVNGVVQDVSELSTQVSGAMEDASQAFAAASSAQQDLDGFKTQVSQTYETKADAGSAMAQEVLDRNSAISQSASSILSQVSENYVDKTTGATYATKTEVEQTADGITSAVAESYQPKGDYATSSDVSDAIAQEVLDRNSAISQSATSITSTVSQTYATKTELSDEVSSLESSISQTSASILSQVKENYVDKTTGATYATKTELSQTKDSITSTVSETYLSKSDAGKTYATQTQLTQTSESLTVSIQQAATAAGNAQSTADSAASSATAANNAAAAAKSAADSASSSAATANSAAAAAQSSADAAQSTADGAVAGVNAINTYFDFKIDGLHVGKRATSASGDEYQTAETVMGADGSFKVKSKDGAVLSKFGAGEIDLGINSSSSIITMCGGKAVVKYSSSRLQIGTSTDPVTIFTDGGKDINIHTADDDPKNHGCLYASDKYAGIFSGNGSSESIGSGGNVSIGFNSSTGKSTAQVRAHQLGLYPLDGSSQTNIELSQVIAALSQQATLSLSYGFKLDRNGTCVTIRSDGSTSITVPGNWGSVSIGTVPAGWRPAGTLWFNTLYCVSPNIYLEVQSTGAVTLVNAGSSSVTTIVNVSGSWCAKQ